MRTLQTKDLGLFSKIVKKMEVKQEIMDMFTDITGKDDKELERIEQQLQIQLVLVLVENYHKAEKEVFKLLSSLDGKTEKEIEEMSLKDFIGLFQELAKDENFQTFFDLVAK